MGNSVIGRIARRIINAAELSDGLPDFERKPRPITQEVRDTLAKLGWEEFAAISRRGELHRSVLEQRLNNGEITPEQAEQIMLENDVSYYIGKLTTDFQVAEHDRIKKSWDSMSFSEQGKALNGLTPPSELKRSTYEWLKKRKMVS